MLKLVLDTSVLISFLCSKSDNYTLEIMEMVENSEVELFTSMEFWIEFKDVLSRPKIQKRFNDKTQYLETFLEWFKENSKIVSITKYNTYCRDPKDDFYLNLALGHNLDYIISLDQDLLVLKQLGKTKILRPREFIEIYKLASGSGFLI